MLEYLSRYIHTISLSDPIPFITAGIGALVCFIIMQTLLVKWKRRYQELAVRHGALQERLALEQQYSREKIDLLEQAGNDMRYQFKQLAQEIFEEKSRTFSRQNSEKLDSLLQPFQNQIAAFRDRVETIFIEETREHSSLKQELLHLRDLNSRINEEAANLTRALSGDRKLQGTWGEMVLERLLEQSGLRKDQEYESQTGLRDQDSRLYKPDIIIHLPGDKDIVVDSKVSLSAWTRYVNAENQEEQTRAMSEHLQALRNHLKSLSTKDYSSLRGLRSLDFVLMFVPIDAAFMTAVQFEEKLIGEMYSRKVIIVTPTTLLATLRTIEYFWQSERQNRNALEIAERASSLYDKLRGFLDDMEKLGKQIDTCRDTYDKALNKLCKGRGNLIAQASSFPELGVKVKEEFSKTMLNETETLTDSSIQ